MNQESRKKLKFAKTQVVAILKSIPSLRAIGVYGSVAEGTAAPDSDIDLIIVCQNGLLHLCRLQIAWRLWRARLRGKVSSGVVVCESALKPGTFQIDENDTYVITWFQNIRWLYKYNSSFIIRNSELLNWLAKQFFSLRFKIDQSKSYPNPHIKFSDEVFFHFGDSMARKAWQKPKKEIYFIYLRSLTGDGKAMWIAKYFDDIVIIGGFFFFILVAAVMGVIIDAVAASISKKQSRENLVFPCLSLPAGILCACLFAWVCEVAIVDNIIAIPAQSVVVRINQASKSELVATFPNECLIWKSDERMRGQVVSYDQVRKEVSLSVSPITDNPKVRKISYKVQVRALGKPESVIPHLEALQGKKLSEWVKYYLYEFNDKKSKELAQFYNPLDDSQQYRFKRLIRDFLEPHLKNAHISLYDTHFSVD